MVCHLTSSEASLYEVLHDQKPEDYEFFVSMLAYGEIICSSKFPSGYIVILTKVKGEMLSHYRIQNELSLEEKLCIYTQCKKRVTVLREMGVYVSDCGSHNVLYCPETKYVTMVDFELTGVTEGRESVDRPELTAIFKRANVDDLKA